MRRFVLRAPRNLPRSTLVLLATVGGVLCAARPASAQAVRLDDPEASFPEAFSVVQTVRELPDGRVLVADPLGQALMALDMDAGRADTVGRVGEGPREYRQPDAVWPLPEGRTLLVDLGNGRLTQLGADLSFGDTRPYTVGEIGPGRDLVLAIPQAVDGQGRLYFRSFGSIGGGAAMADSAYVLRLDPSTNEVDSVTAYKLEGRTRETSGGSGGQNVSIQQIPRSPADAWGVAPDGRVVVARVADYSIEWIGPDGSITRGPANEYRPVRIGQAEKEAWDLERTTSGGGLTMRVEMRNGAMTMSAGRGGVPAGDGDLDQYEWPEALPPFYGGRIPVDPLGRAWVRRHVEAGEDPTYDLFGADGTRVAQVQLLPGRRVVGFGEGAVYTVHSDELGLQYLEWYRAP